MKPEHPLKTWRIEKRLGLVELGKLLDLSPGHISMIENRKRGCSAGVAFRICELTGLSLKSLVRDNRSASAADASN